MARKGEEIELCLVMHEVDIGVTKVDVINKFDDFYLCIPKVIIDYLSICNLYL
ncbi:hypothetical protein GCM10007981_15030 [Thermocladium modestius]|uniref:Uncharacterized protein n=1 Tax=Thermocladium modestius TaxID=62609 RepID=A0A830GZV9_9CREN|nr:hypothetical protein GCM10007981_15030 [Thermocladium modestius]